MSAEMIGQQKCRQLLVMLTISVVRKHRTFIFIFAFVQCKHSMRLTESLWQFTGPLVDATDL